MTEIEEGNQVEKKEIIQALPVEVLALKMVGWDKRVKRYKKDEVLEELERTPVKITLLE